MFVRFVSNGPIAHLNLWSRTGLILTEKATDEPGEGTMMKADLEIPADAQFVELWFMNSGDSGCTYFDSNYGRNYRFEFVTEQIDILDAWITPQEGKAAADSAGEFHIRIAAGLGVAAVFVNYFYWIADVNPPVRRRAELKFTSVDNSNKRIWESDPVSVPTRTALNFDVEFVVEGRSFFDDNSGRHYLVPDRD